ncbi:MAG TPA: acyl-CoA dehydrogenase family protein [Gemmatales bacterium]|nr:acyl-CoA dehydrogenase family protein [Gemmatales bacterium]HMP58146.1 acyl-CoA dehydrogenase family protein [Gemmatales bacterium]
MTATTANLTSGPALNASLRTLAHQAEQADQDALWPTAALAALQAAQVPRWAIPRDADGWGLPLRELLLGYEAIGQACLTTAFILSQREAAVRRLCVSRDRPLADELLPPLARGELWTSVGVAQLTTSRQHLGPTLKARRTSGGIVLEGFVPWVTGAAHSDVLLLGAVDAQGDPMIVGVDADAPGLRIEEPMDLLALRGSCTSLVWCEGVAVKPHEILEDRPERIRTGDGAGGLTTSCLALALMGAALQHLRVESEHRVDLKEPLQRLQARHQRLRSRMLSLAEASNPAAAELTGLRAAATEAALRSTQTLLTLCKGAGYVRPHPAQRWARQALFFLVWSCPKAIGEQIVDRMLAFGADRADGTAKPAADGS